MAKKELSFAGKLKAFLAWNGLFAFILSFNVASLVVAYYVVSTQSIATSVALFLPFLLSGNLPQYFIGSSLFGIGIRHEMKDGRIWPEFAENFFIFKIMRDFLNLSIEVSTELQEAEKQLDAQFIFAIFPHGTGSDFRILMEGMLPQHFPNLSKRKAIRSLAATVLFRIPIIAQIALYTGCIDARKQVAERALSNGKSLVILPGGEAEQLMTQYGIEKIYLRKRKGFIKLAMKKKIPVVPVYVFGCNDMFLTSRLFYKARHFLMKKFGVCIPFCKGLWGSLCPFEVDTSIVFGKPINVFDGMKGDEPTKEELDHSHQIFCEELEKLFEEKKKAFSYGDRKLEIY